MNWILKFKQFVSKPFFTDSRTLFWLWLLIPIIAWLTKLHKLNNYLIFRGVFWHTWHQTPLYTEYPQEYFDTNHYGPFFSLIVAPFAVLPVWAGHLCWEVVMAMVLYWAVRGLSLHHRQRIFVYWFCAHELLTALFMSQFNIAIAAIIVGTYMLIEREKDEWATLLIVVGLFVKLYGVVGLAFFFFSKHKLRFILTFIGWSLLAFVLPMFISSPDYIISQYGAWYESLTSKNVQNMFSTHQNVSLLGMIRKISGSTAYSDLWLILVGLLLFARPYLRWRQYRNESFRYAFLASVLLFVVLFSTGSESSSYIIALVGVVLWYVTCPWQRSRVDLYLMIFAFVLTSMSPSDLFPAFIRRELIQPYALKALPCAIIWCKLVYEMWTRDYSSQTVAVK